MNLRDVAKRNAQHLLHIRSVLQLFVGIAVFTLIGASLYALALSLWRGESLTGYVLNVVAAWIGVVQVLVFLPALLMGSVWVGGTALFEWLLSRLGGTQRIERLTSSDWAWWGAAIPSGAVGLLLFGVGYWVGIDSVVSLPAIGPRIPQFFPWMRGE